MWRNISSSQAPAGQGASPVVGLLARIFRKYGPRKHTIRPRKGSSRNLGAGYISHQEEFWHHKNGRQRLDISSVSVIYSGMCPRSLQIVSCQS